MGRLVEGLWDCKYCDTKRIRGSVRDCPNCGRPRDENTKFYLPNTIEYVEDEKAKTINKNPDWICEYCNSLNSDSEKTCKSCGSVRTNENLDYFSNHNKKNSSTYNYKYSNEESYGTNTTMIDDNTEEYYSKSNVSFPKINYKRFLILFLILSLIGALVYICIPKNDSITINNFYWERSIEIEKYQTVNENNWFLPQNARLQYTNEEIYDYEEVFDHYETRSRQVARERLVGYEEYVSGHRDLGNGYFEEITSQRPVYETYYETEYYNEPVYISVPIYKTKYYYEIDKWLYDRSLKTSAKNQLPYWHDISELKNNERVSTKNESYYIIGTNPKGKNKKVPLEYETWKDLNIGEKINVKVSIFNNFQ